MRTKLLALTLALLGAGCFGDLSTNGGNTGGGGGGGNGGGEGGGGGGGGPGGGGPNCGATTFPIKASNSAPPNVMLVTDFSSSMRETVPGTSQTKLDALRGAVNSLLYSYESKARWGLSIFPNPEAGNSDRCGNGVACNCNPGKVDIGLGGTGSAITSRIGGNTPPNNGTYATPTGRTVKAIYDSRQLIDASRNNFVILVTDGQPTCQTCRDDNNDNLCDKDANGKTIPGPDMDVVTPISQLYATAPSVRTFVIGVGEGTYSVDGRTGIDGKQLLSSWAVAGHTDRPGALKYYQVGNISELDQAFAEIITGAVSCTYRLDKTPDSPDNMIPYIDNVAVPRSATNGFTYDSGSNSIVFHGTSCTTLQSGAKKVDVIYGCPSEVIM